MVALFAISSVTVGYADDASAAAEGKDAVKLQQFVTIDDSYIRFGAKNKGAVDENTIDRRTGQLNISGQVTQCTPMSSKRQF
jgi:hypothetical protein